MIGLAVVSRPLIIFLLTEKWLLSVPFVILTAIICMFWPLSVFTHAINAVGKSGLALKLNFLSISLALLLMALSYQYGILFFISSTIISNFISNSITMIIASRLFGFKVREILKDIAPNFNNFYINGFLCLSSFLFTTACFYTINYSNNCRSFVLFNNYLAF